MLNLKGINTNIKNIKNAGIKLDQRIHETGVSIMQHAADHGDWTPMQRLFDALPKAGRKKAFVTWVVSFTPLKFDDKLGTFVKSKKSKREYDVAGANATPFWDYTKEVAQTLDVDKLLDLSKLIDQALERVEKAQEAGATIKGDMQAFNQRAQQLKTNAHAIH